MDNYVTLVGVDAIERAAAKMEEAANKMAQAAKDIDYTLTNHERFLEDWERRLYNSLQELLPQEGTVFDVRVIKDDEDTVVVAAPNTLSEITLEDAIPSLAEQEGPVD